MPGVEKNSTYLIEITGMTHEGQGVGRIEGLAVFIDGALEGEQAEVKVIKVNKSYAVGKLMKVLTPSQNRIEPFCNAYKRCGGCNLQYMDYSAQLDFKKKLVRDNLERIGGLKDIKLRDTIGMQRPLNYRNKAQYPVASVGGVVITGFYAARSHDVIESGTCGIQDRMSDKVRETVRRFIVEKGISAYDETTGKGLMRHIVTRVGFHTGEVMVVLVINGKSLPFAEELVQRLVSGGIEPDTRAENSAGTFAAAYDAAIEAPPAGACGDSSGETTGSIPNEIFGKNPSETPSEIPGKTPGGSSACSGNNAISEKNVIKSIYLNINTDNTNVILGRKNILLYGSETITDTIGGHKFLISPHSFFQVNPVQTEVLYGKALEYAGLTGTETVFDLYCGIGTISLFLSARARKVYGVEVVEAATEDARKNAKLNGIENAEFLCGEAEKVVPELYRQGVRADVVVLDPPRKGCDESLLQLLADMRPDRIVYVSCNPATLARDVKHLDGKGYRTVEVQPVDMFPWTGHVECVIMMTYSGFKGK